MLVRRGAPPRLLDGVAGTLIGIEPKLGFASSTLQLEPGDALFLYTDGVTEAFNPEQACFGEERMLKAIGSGPPRAMVAQVLEAVRTFARGEPQSDDIALLCVRWLGTGELQLKLHSTPADVARGYQAVQSFLVSRGLDADTVHAVALAVEEALSNLVRHGYAGTAGPIFLRARVGQADIQLEIRDRGLHFDPRTAKPPHLEVPLDERASGDLGIHLIRNVIDRIAYQRDGDENLLTLVRDLPHTP